MYGMSHAQVSCANGTEKHAPTLAGFLQPQVGGLQQLRCSRSGPNFNMQLLITRLFVSLAGPLSLGNQTFLL